MIDSAICIVTECFMEDKDVTVEVTLLIKNQDAERYIANQKNTLRTV